MNKVKRLINSYNTFISVPWRNDAAAAQRVIFCVYTENEELRLRARIDEFEIVTCQASHDWALYDLTDTFPDWLSGQRYAKSYFEKPHLLPTLLPKYLGYIVQEFKKFLDDRNVTDNSVVAIKRVSGRCSAL